MIWVGANGMEQSLLRAVCHAWPQAALWIADVAPFGSDFDSRSAVATCPQEKLRLAEASARLLGDDERRALSAQWRALTRSDHTLRLYLDGELRGCDETFFDDALLAQCEPTFKCAIHVVGHVMGEAADYISDTFLFHRLRTLVTQQRIEVEDGEATLRRMMVRRA